MRRNTQKMRRYSQKEIDFLKANIVGCRYKALTEMFNKRFGTKKAVLSIQNTCWRNGFNNFLRGAENNKGGNRKKPVGSERVRHGLVWVKVRNPDVWKPKHRLVWEAANGKIPKNSVVSFMDGNTLNPSLNNLLLIKRAELIVMNKLNLFSKNKDLTKIGKSIAEIILLAAKRKRELKHRSKK